MSITAILTLGFMLGMRHATDADHVVAVSAIVSRERTLRAAVPIGILWGIGHTVTLLIAGGIIILFDVVISPHVGLAMELCVALMLVFLGGLNIGNVLRESKGNAVHLRARAHPHGHGGRSRAALSLRPLVVGVIHGLAGSAAIALLVLSAVRDAAWAACYLLVFGAGTIAGMLLVTAAMALPITAAARSFARVHRALGLLTGFAGIIWGVVLVTRLASCTACLPRTHSGFLAESGPRAAE